MSDTEKNFVYVKTKIDLEDIEVPNPVVLDPKAQDYIYCMFLSDYYKKKCEFIEAIERYGYECGKQDEFEKKEWLTKILGYHSELVDILMRGILKEREHGDKS